MTKGFSVGQKIELTKYTGKRKELEGERTFVGQILDEKEDNRLVISMPMEDGKMVLFEVGERYNMFFYTAEGLYYCIAQVGDRYLLGQVFMLEMECASEIEKFERRKFFRLNCIIDMDYQRDGEPQEEKRAATIIDISGGGARFNAGEEFAPGDGLRIDFALSMGGWLEKFSIHVRVIASTCLRNREKTYENRVEFQDISEMDRETIVKYVFEEERRRRKKESGMR